MPLAGDIMLSDFSLCGIIKMEMLSQITSMSAVLSTVCAQHIQDAGSFFVIIKLWI